MDPPLTSTLSPDTIEIRAPDSTSPAETATLTLPAAPEVAKPVPIATEPVLPYLASPDLSNIEPLVPLDPPNDVKRLNAPVD